ncbi:Hypothetical predicted protein [Paramuricea clavata]|uniref:Uncharacterized protein n=1 Tax=Paramuricea clavata TaxID=317549 RepID=A0A7D9IQZ0_PARCT|nr:Hypothetical predicted protein [Paramuricea clavata]
MNSLLFLIVVIASNFVNVQTNNSTTVASMYVSEMSTSFQTGSVLAFKNTVGISKATNSKSNYPHSSMKIPSSAMPMASSSDGLKTGINPSNMIKPTSPPVTTRSPSESLVFVQDTASVMNSNISLSTERAPWAITATLSVIPSTTIPSYSVAQFTTHAVVTSNVPATTNVTKESIIVQPNVTRIIQATPSAIASSTSSSDTQYVSSMIPSAAMMVTSDTITTLVNSTTAPILNATTTSTVMMKATRSTVQNMTTPPDTVNSSTSRMIVSSSSPTSVPTTSTTMPRNATMPNTTVQSPTSATNASVFLSAVMPTDSLTEKMTTSFETHIRTTPVVNMTSSMKGISSSPTISSMTHPSSSEVITPVPPEIDLVRITIDANCSQVPNHQSNDFKAAVQLSVSEVLNISSSKINISAVTCGSIIVDMAIEKVNNENITQKLMDAVSNNQLNISYNNETLAVTSANRLTTKPITPTLTTLSVSRDSLTSNPMSSTTIVTETLSGSPQSETTSQMLAKSSTLPVKSDSDTAPVMSTRAINASIFLNATMFSSAVIQTVSPTEKMTTSLETHVRTTPVVNMTNSMKGLSSSPAISSMTHPSSSQVITPVHSEIVLVRITIDANCSQVPNHQSTDFNTAVQLSVSEVLNISSSKINISAVTCGSIIVDMAIENVNNENITQKLMDAVNNNQLNISYNNETLAVTSVNRLTTKPITPTLTTLSVSSTTIVTETLSGSPQRETTSQVLAQSSTLPVMSASDTASAMSTQAINESIFLNATMFSSAVMQTVSPTGKMTMSFVTNVTTSPVENMTTRATNSSIFAKATVLSSHSSAIMQTMSPTGKMPPVVNMTMSPTGKTNTSFATHVRTSPVVNMTSSMKGLSSSPAISSMAHRSSSQVTTPAFPAVLVRITIDANCNRVPSQSTTFKDAVRSSCSKVLNISASKIKITAVKCGSILVDMEIQNENNENIIRKLEDAVNNNQLNISYNGTQLAVTSVKELSTKPTSKNDDDDDNTALIIYIVFGSVLGLAFLIALVTLIVRCRRERSTGMFHLPSEENLELSGFSVQNKPYQGQGGNFYGELQPESSELRISCIPDESDPAPNDSAGGTEDGGGFGGSYLPAWKNLPTMDMSEVNRNDDTNDNLLLTYGKTDVEEGKDSGKTDVVTSYDNVAAV